MLSSSIWWHDLHFVQRYTNCLLNPSRMHGTIECSSLWCNVILFWKLFAILLDSCTILHLMQCYHSCVILLLFSFIINSNHSLVYPLISASSSSPVLPFLITFRAKLGRTPASAYGNNVTSCVNLTIISTTLPGPYTFRSSDSNFGLNETRAMWGAASLNVSTNMCEECAAKLYDILAGTSAIITTWRLGPWQCADLWEWVRRREGRIVC